MLRTTVVLAAAALCASANGLPAWKQQGVIDTSKSPHAKLTPVPVHAVRFGEGFWQKRMKLNADKGLPIHIEDHEREGVMDNFRRLTGKNVERKSFLWSDEYLYKLMEAMAFVLQTEDKPEMRKQLESLVDMVIAAQQPDGYLNTYYVRENAEKRFTFMQGSHELYCYGHMIQAAAAYYRATGNRRFIDAAVRYLDFLTANYGRDKKPLTDGHPEAEMALVELYRITGDRRALDFAGYLLEGDGARLGWSNQDYQRLFAGIPITSRQILEGHAVRAMYAASGAADYFAETGDAKYGETLERFWKDQQHGKMYITGAVGSSVENENFSVDPYELHNREGWGETCAAIANMMWQYRLLQIRGEARFADVMERAMYNGVNSGYGVNGTTYCYRNPLEMDARKHRGNGAMCCSPNINRTMASLPGYFYSTSDDGIYVHLFHNSKLDWKLENGTALKIEQATNYPWNGDVQMVVSPAKASTFTMYVRIPSWTRSAKLLVNGSAVAAKPGSYVPVRREWKAGDKVQLTLDMEPQVIQSHPRLKENQGRVAIQRGPVVYTLEHLDQNGLPVFFDVAIALDRRNPDAGFTVEERPDLLGGVTVVKHKGAYYTPSLATEPLYQRAADLKPRKTAPVQLTFIPYFAYANREPSAMQVWVPYLFE